MNYASSPLLVAKKRRIAQYGRSSSENWKSGIPINNIPCYRQRLQFSSNPCRTSLRNRRWLQKADRRPHRLVLPLLLLRDDLVGVIAVVVVSSSRICLGFSSVVVVGLKLSWSDESVAIVWENWRLRENGTSDCLLLSHLSFGFWFWERIWFWFLGFWEEKEELRVSLLSPCTNLSFFLFFFFFSFLF